MAYKKKTESEKLRNRYYRLSKNANDAAIRIMEEHGVSEEIIYNEDSRISVDNAKVSKIVLYASHMSEKTVKIILTDNTSIILNFLPLDEQIHLVCILDQLDKHIRMGWAEIK